MSSNTCANCGKEGTDVTNTCNKCKSVVYCNAACKKKHRHKHKKQCERRIAELHDKELFKQPPPLDDCPICFLRMPSLSLGKVYMACCGKVLCRGCIYAVQSQDGASLCPFCRTPAPSSEGEMIRRCRKRMELNDGEAIRSVGIYYGQGQYGLPRNIAKSLELFHRAGELGNISAYVNIGNAYSPHLENQGFGVEVNKEKAVHYYELAAIGGHIDARHNLGNFEMMECDIDRALKHWMIAVEGGSKDSLENIKRFYKARHRQVPKDAYANALRAYQKYLGEIKSNQRDEAAAVDIDWTYYE